MKTMLGLSWVVYIAILTRLFLVPSGALLIVNIILAFVIGLQTARSLTLKQKDSHAKALSFVLIVGLLGLALAFGTAGAWVLAPS